MQTVPPVTPTALIGIPVLIGIHVAIASHRPTVTLALLTIQKTSAPVLLINQARPSSYEAKRA
jgi:hypothetical protein